jgi:excisionase family DNA binding protein
LVVEVARLVRAPVETVRWWIRTGKLPASKPGRRLLIRRSDLQNLLTACAARGAADAEATRGVALANGKGEG